MKFGYNFGEECKEKKRKVVESWMTGDNECDEESKRYECGGVYYHNYVDVVGCKDHDSFWDCSECKKNQVRETKREDG